MFKFLNIFKRKKEKKNMIKKYEIEVFDEDLLDNGRIHLKPVGRQVVEASSPKELINIFKMCGQQIKILREIEEPVNKQEPISQPVNQPISQPQLNVSNLSSTSISNVAPISNSFPAISAEQKYYMIGDIELKSENGIIYQRAWVPATDTESQHIRIINDKTKKPISLLEKHIEIKKWIKVDSAIIKNVDNLNLE
jgi:hypothetical protein